MFRVALRKSICGQQQSLVRSRLLHASNGRPVFQQAGFGKVLVVLTPIAAGAGVVTYAKHDAQFKRLLIESVPGIEPVLKVLLQEEGNALESVTKTFNQASQKVSDISNTITGFIGGSKAPEPPVAPLKKSVVAPLVHKPSSSVEPTLSVPAPPLPTISPPTPVGNANKSAAAPVAKPPTSAAAASPSPASPSAAKGPSSPVQLSPAAPLPANIHELERAVEVAAQTAVNAYGRAIDVLKEYNEEVKKIVDESVDKFDTNAWSKLKNKTSARDSAVLASEKAAQVARATIDNLERSVHAIAKNSPPELIERVGNHIRATSDHLNAAKDQMYNAKDAAQVSEKFWRNVEASRNYFIDEVEALFPGVDLAAKKVNLSPEDFNLFVVYAYSHVLAYQKEVQKWQVDGETRLRRALDALRGDDQTEALRSQLEFHLQKERQQLELSNKKKLFAIRAEAEKDLRLHMKRQAAAHADHLKDVLQQKEAELKRLFDREMNEKLYSEQAAYKEQLAGMLGKLKGMDAALKARGETDRMVHQAQSLWSACQALWASVRNGEPGVSWQHKLRPLASEVSAVSRSAEGDELVAVVLKGVPAEAKTRGVYPEDALRERFVKVEQLARRLALVPADGARLPIYFLSYLQSVFILTPDNVISREELSNEPVDVSKFDTYDILNRAKYFMERGDLVQTLKYMNLLQGAPRKIAADWLKEARLLLETQQATNILMAHAATSGLSFL